MKYLLFLCLLFISCTFQRTFTSEVKKSIRNRFVDETGIESLINMNGYYKYSFRADISEGYGKDMKFIDSVTDNMLFFKDGTCVQSVRLKKGLNEQQITKEIDGIWGIYRIEKDTIIAQMIPFVNISNAWVVYELYIKIVDRNTLNFLWKKLVFMENDKLENNEIEEKEKTATLMKFQEAGKILSPDNWLKKEEWLWATKSDWEEYMKKKR